jgi:hypothetical protein
MEINLTFPVFAISQDGDYYSIDVDDHDQATSGFVIFTTREGAEEFIRDQNLDAATVRLANSHRFLRFLGSLDDPNPSIVCDVIRDKNGDLKPRWSAQSEFLVEHTLPRIGFIWDYPLHFIFDPRGLASIEGTTPDDQTVTLVAIFTDADLAERYQREADVAGEIGEIADEGGFLDFVNDLGDTTDGIIVDPTNAAPGSTANLCYSKEKLIEQLTPDEIG